MKFTILFLYLGLTSCISPKIYIIDQPTIMEMESSGDWPEINKQKLSILSTPGPTPFSKTKKNYKSQQLQSLLNEEAVD